MEPLKQNPNCRDTFVTLRIYSEQTSPDVMTDTLGLQPTAVRRHGEPLDEDRTEQRYAWHSWRLSSAEAVASTVCELHMDWLLDQLAPRADALHALQSQRCLTHVELYWLSAHGHWGPTLLATHA